MRRSSGGWRSLSISAIVKPRNLPTKCKICREATRCVVWSSSQYVHYIAEWHYLFFTLCLFFVNSGGLSAFPGARWAHQLCGNQGLSPWWPAGGGEHASAEGRWSSAPDDLLQRVLRWRPTQWRVQQPRQGEYATFLPFTPLEVYVCVRVWLLTRTPAVTVLEVRMNRIMR